MHFGGFDKEATSFELWIFKRIALPIVIILGCFALYSCEQRKIACNNYCLDQGYLGYKVQRLKALPDECYCYPTEDTKSKEAYNSRVKVYVPK
jgi:hypothetical protein